MVKELSKDIRAVLHHFRPTGTTKKPSPKVEADASGLVGGHDSGLLVVPESQGEGEQGVHVVSQPRTSSSWTVHPPQVPITFEDRTSSKYAQQPFHNSALPQMINTSTFTPPPWLVPNAPTASTWSGSVQQHPNPSGTNSRWAVPGINPANMNSGQGRRNQNESVMLKRIAELEEQLATMRHLNQIQREKTSKGASRSDPNKTQNDLQKKGRLEEEGWQKNRDYRLRWQEGMESHKSKYQNSATGKRDQGESETEEEGDWNRRPENRPTNRRRTLEYPTHGLWRAVGCDETSESEEDRYRNQVRLTGIQGNNPITQGYIRNAEHRRDSHLQRERRFGTNNGPGYLASSGEETFEDQRDRRRRGSRRISDAEIQNADRRMEKWHLTFDGDSCHRSLEDFLHKVKMLARMDRIPEKVLLQRIHTILRKEAYDWYLCYSDELSNWEEFEERIRYMYGNPYKDQGNRQKIYERKQQRNETFLSFKMELERLNKMLSKPVNQRRLFEVIWDNMRPHYRSRLACRTVENLRQLEYYAYRIDANDPALRGPREGGLKMSNIHNIEVEEDSDPAYSDNTENNEINAIGRSFGKFDQRQEQAKGSQKREEEPHPVPAVERPFCWNCRKQGHQWRQCKEEKKVFCYICGNPGKTSTFCESHPRANQSRAGN